MKKNTQKLLLALYSDSNKIKSRVKISDLKFFFSELSDGGYRSLIHLLKKKNIVTTQRLLGSTSISITDHGKMLLESEFPALSAKWDEWSGEWECLVFLSPPLFDKRFRLLRKALIFEGALAVNRGVYMFPTGFSERVIESCRNDYYKNVLIFSVGGWKIALESSFIVKNYGLLDLVEIYSGVSNDVARLTSSFLKEKGLTKKQKQEMTMVYDRLVDVLSEDPGFCTYYIKEVEKVKNIVQQLNSLLIQ